MAFKLNAGEGENKPKRADIYGFIPSEIVVDWEKNHSRSGEVITEESVKGLIADFLNPDVGQLQPVTVFRRESDQKVEIGLGFRRLKAALAVQKIQPEFRLDAIVRTNVNEKDVFLLNLKENVGRKDTNPIQNARSARHLKTAYKYKTAEIAEVFGVSVPQIGNLFQLLTLPEKVQERVASGKLTVSAALKFVKIAPEEIDAALDEATDEDGNVDGGSAAKAARRRGVKVGRTASELRAVLKDREDAISVAILGFLAGNLDEIVLISALDREVMDDFSEDELIETTVMV